MITDPRLASLISRAQARLPPRIQVAASPYTNPDSLHPVERASIAKATPARQTEFAGGRSAARAAMRALIGTASPVPMGPDRAPIWPGGVTGSITHSAGICLAAVAETSFFDSIGIDLEPDSPLPADLAPEVLLPAERHLHSRAVFSAKESVFKALHPLCRVMFGFDAVQISFPNQGFEALLHYSLGRFPRDLRLKGQFLRSDGFVLTALAIQPSGR